MTRVASILTNKNHLPLIYALAFGMPGIPCVYYGSEWGAEGRKEDGDPALRPSFEKPEWNDLTEWISKLAEAKKQSKALQYGNFMSKVLTNGQCVFEREWEGERLSLIHILWVEEIDALAPEQKNKAKFADGSTAACGLLCDLMHLEGAKALASYEEDFYAGMPAASKNTYGKGTTYYIATQFEEEGLAKILDQAVQEAGVSSVIPEETGLEVVTRVSDTTRFYFVMNFTDEEQILPESLTGKKDMISQKMTEHGMKLKKWNRVVSLTRVTTSSPVSYTHLNFSAVRSSI